MGIEINGQNRNIKVNGRELSTFDTNQDSRIQGKELIDFNTNVIKDSSLTDDNYKKLFGYEKLTWQGNNDTAVRFMADALTSTANKGLGDREAIIDALYAKYKGFATNEKAQELINKSIKIYDVFASKPRGSKDEIDKLFNAVKKDLKKDGKVGKFEQEIIDVLVAQAEIEQANKEYSKFSEKYNELKETMSWDEAFTKASKMKEFQGSYYDNKIWTGNGGHTVLQTARGEYVDGVKKNFENEVIMSDATNLVIGTMNKIKNEIIEGQRDSKGFDNKKLKELTEQELKANKKWNKYTKKALNGDVKFMSRKWWLGEDSQMKTNRKNNVAEVNVKLARSKTFSNKEVLDKIDATLRDELLVAGYLTEVKDDEGNFAGYSIKNLSEELECFGSDYTLNPQLPEFKALSETLSAKVRAAVNRDISLTDEQVEQLAELCKYRIGSKVSTAKTALRGVVGAAIPAGTGAAAAAGAEAWRGDRPFHRWYNHKYTGKLELNITNLINIFDQNGILTSQQKDYLSNAAIDNAAIDGNGTIVVKTDTGIEITYPDNMLIEIKDDVKSQVGLQAIKGLAIGAAIGLITGTIGALTNKANIGEYPLISTDYGCDGHNLEIDTLEKYEKALNVCVSDGTISENEKRGLMLIARTFEKDGQWDCKEFKSFLREVAGGESVMNRDEFYMALAKKWTEKYLNPEEKKVCITAPKQEKTPAVTTKLDTINGDKYQWQDIVKQYDCDDITPTMKVRYLKIAQGITDGKFDDKERLDYINSFSKQILKRQYRVERSEDGKDATTIIGNVVIEHFDADKYRNQLVTAVKGTIVMPENLAGCNRNKNIALVSRKSSGKPKNVERNNTLYDETTTPGTESTRPGYYEETINGKKGKSGVIENMDQYNKIKEQYKDWNQDC